MDKLVEKLQKIGVGSVIIADDTNENILAAQEIGNSLSPIKFEYYNRGDLVIAQIPKRYREIDLILTDLKMEKPDSGLDVLEKGYLHGIPTYVCSGGYSHGAHTYTRTGPEKIFLGDNMLKNMPETWYKLMNGICDKVEKGASLSASIFLYRNILKDSKDWNGMQDNFISEMIRSTCEYKLEIQRR